jgi:hypothetical protein
MERSSAFGAAKKDLLFVVLCSKRRQMYCSSRRRSLKTSAGKRIEEEKESTNQLEKRKAKQRNETEVFGVFCNRMT